MGIETKVDLAEIENDYSQTITIWDYFAARAMAKLMENFPMSNAEEISRIAFQYSDEMMKERAKRMKL